MDENDNRIHQISFEIEFVTVSTGRPVQHVPAACQGLLQELTVEITPPGRLPDVVACQRLHRRTPVSPPDRCSTRHSSTSKPW